jgi:peptidoglycan/xylan/chitin deacetylase (PgdA/CDA1 family)
MPFSFQAIKSSVRKVATVPLLLGLWKPLRRTISILTYHRVTNDPNARNVFNPNLSLYVDANNLDRQLRFLKANSNCLSLGNAVRNLEKGVGATHGGVALTFDDGYKDNLTLALPIAEKYGVPFTIFVTTGFLDRTADLWWDEQRFIIERCTKLSLDYGQRTYSWIVETLEEKYHAAQQLRILFKEMDLVKQQTSLAQLRLQCPETYTYDSEMLSWDDLRELSKHPLVTLGVHTCSHAVLSRLSDSEVDMEMRSSRAVLRDRLGLDFDFFAYPMGQKEHADKREFALAEKAQFKAAFTSRSGTLPSLRSHSMFEIPRIPVDYDDTLSSFAWKAAGL